MPKPPHFDVNEMAGQLDSLFMLFCEAVGLRRQVAPDAISKALALVVSVANSDHKPADAPKLPLAVDTLMTALTTAPGGGSAPTYGTFWRGDIGRAILIASARVQSDERITKEQAAALLGNAIQHVMLLTRTEVLTVDDANMLRAGDVLAYYEQAARRAYRKAKS